MVRYGISNLIFDKLNKDNLNNLVKTAQICDFAPTAHYGSWDAMPETLPSCPYSGSPMEISALQSLFFQMKGASLLQDQYGYEIIERQLFKLAYAANAAGAKYLIFGSPATRKYSSPKLHIYELHDRIMRLADICRSANVLLCFEVNSPKFGGDFLVSNVELFELIETLNHPGLGLHLDLGQMSEAGDDVSAILSKTAGQLNHLHLSAPNFDLSPERMSLYCDVIAELKVLQQPVDVVLEVQHLLDAECNSLVNMSEELALACS